MAKRVTINEPNLPWVNHGEDRRFRILTTVILVLFFGLGLFLNALELPEPERKELVDVSPRLAKLILEKEKVTPPPKPKPKPPEKKEVEKKKKEPEKKKEVEKKKEPEKKKTAKEVAQNTGLIALSDELADLRETFDLEDAPQPQTNKGNQAVKVATASDLLTSTAAGGSGGIQTSALNRKITTSELSQRQTTQVKSNIETEQTQVAKAETASGKQKGGAGTRTSNEIERVFQKNKGPIFQIYNRALRKNPALQGKVVVEITINPDGSVKSAKILSSELGDEKLERKLLLKIKRFKFAKANVNEITVTYPIDFLPS
ncbi:MAG: AgmX/PglI C-terminal domain-containing protein [Gammaproteobacteria bacterium]|nr:AgmX/PglI C-terminal domain-containing protein [Gammaproteobacteria bacterium]